MLVDFEAVLLDLKAVLVTKASHGRDALLAEIAGLEVKHRVTEGLPEKALRLYGEELADALRPAVSPPSLEAADGHNDTAVLDAAAHRSTQEDHHAPGVPVGAR